MDPKSQEVLEYLPLFPLNTVLFPGVVLPLHIFEERYKEMFKYAIDNAGQFGLSYRSDAEVGKETVPEPGSVGCAAKINVVLPLESGRMNILSTGLVRYRVVEMTQLSPFLIAKIQPFTDDPEPNEDLTDFFENTKEVGKKYFSMLQAINDVSVSGDLDLPEEAEPYSLFVASVLSVSNDEKQQLLEITSTRLRLARVRHYLSRSIAEAEARLSRHESAKSNGHGKLQSGN